MSEWRLRAELRPWQEQALQNWHATGRRGIVDSATGTGKTVLAFAAAASLHAEFGDELKVVIVVPTLPLVDQWRTSLTKDLHVPPHRIGEMSGSPSRGWDDTRDDVLIATLNSARDWLAGALEAWHRDGKRVLLIVDECHRAASPVNSLMFDSEYEYSLGLSATVERDDDAHRSVLYPNIGPIVFTYPLLDALNDGALAPLTSVVLYVNFEPDEECEWGQLSTEMTHLWNALGAIYPKVHETSRSTMPYIKRLAEGGVPEAQSLLGVTY